ncbi:tail assembly chaperone [Limosilactobacillus mucosae]|uniref:tail assembly chaperone n=1 Tax=Limosilactobacillus mucosae TaxID=97478 RepID=UPI0022E7BBDE|nr:tail assembly chaperone [Limosilactobacillus mucosae]
MELTINDKKVELKFGVRFLRELDKIASVENSGIKFGMGLSRSILGLRAYDAAVLADVLYAASYGKVGQATIDNYLDNCENLEKIFDDVIKEISESNAANLAVKKMKA